MDEARSRIHWQCRRGMRELDLLLQAFLDAGYDALTGPERDAFHGLLRCPDPLLLEYLMGRLTPSDPLTADVVARIRRTAAT